MDRRCLIALLLAAAGARGDRDTPEQAADKVLAAVAAGNEGALEALASRRKPGPWFVADELCFRGEHDAADAFARAAPGRNAASLPAYVASRRDRAPEVEARKTYRSVDTTEASVITRALMVKFYELWEKHPPATALKKAQELVASHEKWNHPYYWAAWQLWGLGD